MKSKHVCLPEKKKNLYKHWSVCVFIAVDGCNLQEIVSQYCAAPLHQRNGFLKHKHTCTHPHAHPPAHYPSTDNNKMHVLISVKRFVLKKEKKGNKKRNCYYLISYIHVAVMEICTFSLCVSCFHSACISINPLTENSVKWPLTLYRKIKENKQTKKKNTCRTFYLPLKLWETLHTWL